MRPLDFPALFGPDDGDDLAIVHVEAEPLADEALAVAGVDLRDLQEGPPQPDRERRRSPSRLVADVEDVRVREHVHHEVPVDPEADPLKERLKPVGGPVVDDAAG